MNRVTALINHENAFVRRYMGGFTGILRWPQLDQLWQWLREHHHNQWYLYQTDQAAPDEPESTETLERALDEIDHYLRQTHNADYCGVVYVDNLQQPGYIKVYNPKGMGSSCSMSEIPPMPKWIISLEPPQDLRPLLEAPEKNRHWWKVW